MVIRALTSKRSRAFLLTELMVALAILVIAVLPVGFALNRDTNSFRVIYQRAIGMEIVDGELEILAAGPGRATPEGSHPYTLQADALTNLPPGQFTLTRSGDRLRLEWRSTKHQGLGPIIRETTLK